MESVQISPCGFICEREESWCQQISSWKYGHSETPTTKTSILTFLENEKAFCENNLHQITEQLRKIHENIIYRFSQG